MMAGAGGDLKVLNLNSSVTRQRLRSRSRKIKPQRRLVGLCFPGGVVMILDYDNRVAPQFHRHARGKILRLLPRRPDADDRFAIRFQSRATVRRTVADMRIAAVALERLARIVLRKNSV